MRPASCVPRDVEAIGISGEYLNKLHAEGILERPSRGLYVLTDAEPSERRTIAEACKRVPRGTVCLLSALRFHDLTTQAPFEVWLALDEKARLPKVDYPPTSDRSLLPGGTHFRSSTTKGRGCSDSNILPCEDGGRLFQISQQDWPGCGDRSSTRLLATEKHGTMDELWEAAKVCRMSNVMRPYMETLT